MTAPADPLLQQLLDANADKRRRLAELENEDLDRRLTALERRMQRGETRQSSLTRVLWLFAIMFVIALVVFTQRQRLVPLVSQLAARVSGTPLVTVDGKPVSELVPTVKAAAAQLAATPEPTDAPAPTEVPTLGLGASVPQAPTGTPEPPMEAAAAPVADAQPSATPIPPAAPPQPTMPPVVPTEPPAPILPTATQEPMAQPVANAQQDAPKQSAANGEPQIDYTDQNANGTAIAQAALMNVYKTAQALQQKGFRP